MVFGFGKKKNDDIQQVRETIVPPMPMPPRPLGYPDLERIDMPPVSAPKQFAPLFIKIDRYKEVLQKVQKMRANVKSIDAMIRLQDEINKIKTDTEIMLKRGVEEFEMLADQLDQELVRPQHFEPFIKEHVDMKAGEQIKDVEDEIEKLKKHLQDI